MKPKLLYIGHAYHNKTKSTAFLKDMFACDYDIETFDFDPYNDDIKTHFLPLKGKKYDVLVIFQIMPHLDELKKYISFEHCAFFPMYDGATPRDNPIWYEYRDVNIINFSKTLHDELKSIGLSSYYFQFFPKPLKITDEGDEKSIFFWQRINQININTVGQLIDFKNMKHIHFHHAIDPGQEFVEPDEWINKKATHSTWFDTREDMQKQMQKSAIYIAPRAFEGIGMSFLEAMAMGRCVIAPNNPTMNEYIKNGENGVLYDLNNLQPVDLSNVRKIQKNTIKYIKDGFENWEKEKWKIIEVLTKTPVTDNVALYKKYVKQEKSEINKKYSLFGVIPLLRVVGKRDRLMCKLFYKIPFVLIKGDESRRRVYLFGIPLLKIKQIDNHVETPMVTGPVEISMNLQNTKNPKGRILMVFHLNFLKRDRGCSNYTYEIARMLKDMGYAIDFFSADVFSNTEYDDIKKWNDKEHLIDNFYFSNWKSGLSSKEIEQKAFTDLTWSNDIVRTYFEKIAKENNYDAININYIQWADLVRNGKQLFPNTKLTYTCHDTHFNQVLYSCFDKSLQEKANAVANAMEQEIKYFDLFDSVICISHDEMLFWQKFFPDKEFIFLPHPLKEIKYDKKNEDIDVLYLAAYNPYNLHGLEWFVEKVYPNIKKKINITICGKVNQFLKQNNPAYIDKMKKMGFNLIDFADDLDELYSNTRVVIVPLYEGTGMKIKTVEAMSHNIPIVSRSPGVDGFPDKNNNGILVTDDSKIFAEYLEKLLKDDDFYKKTQKQMGEYFKKYFERDALYDNLKNMFKGGE